MAKISTPILLQITREGVEPQVEEFNEHIIKIGKLSSVNLRLDDPNVNRIHAVIEVTAEEEAQIIDMGSSKGTRVNDKRVHKSRLVSGDAIQLGDTFITIHIGEAAVAQAKNGGSAEEEVVPNVATMPPVEEPADEAGTVVGPAPTAPPAAVAAPEEPEEDTAAVTPEQAAAVQSALAAQAAPADNVQVAVQETPAVPEEDTEHVDPMAAQAVQAAVAPPDNEGGTVVSTMPQPPAEQAAPQMVAQVAPEPQPVFQQPVAQPQAQWNEPQPQQAYASTPPQADPNAGYAYAQQQQPMAQAAPQPMMQQPQGFTSQPPQQPQYIGGFAPAQQQPMTGGWPAQAQAVQPQMHSAPPSQPALGAPSSPALSQSSASMVDLSAAEFADSQEALEVRVIWGDTILDHNHFYEPKRITVGESRKNTFSLSSEALPEGIDSFPLIETEGDRLLINFTDRMGGELHLKDQVVPIAQIKQSAKVQQTSLGYQFALPAQSRVRLFVGDLTFEISFVPAPKRLPPAVLNQMDHHLARSMGTSFLIHGVLILLMLFADENPSMLDEDFFKQGNRFAQLIVRPEEPEKEKKRKKKSGGAKAKGDKGKLGKKKAPKKNRKAAQKKKNPDATSPIDLKKIEKAVDLDIAKKGVLGLINKGGNRLGSIMDTKGFGGADANAVGGWIGSKAGDASGSAGLGAGGLGSGGGGFSGDSVGLARVGTYGRGGGKGGRGWGRSKLRNKRRQTIKVSTGPPDIFGGLDKEIIRRIINQHRSRFKYCYERELIKNQSLQGKIHVWFQIEPNGRVYKSRISRSTMNNDRVEECLARRVKLLRFPSPKGGGVVHVNYPFIFRPS